MEKTGNPLRHGVQRSRFDSHFVDLWICLQHGSDARGWWAVASGELLGGDPAEAD